jgi:hypothetical protein
MLLTPLDLSIDPEKLEVQLTRAFQIASEWKAVLLLDETDVYLQRRNVMHLERGRLVATFLRLLEYYQEIFFLTTNMPGDFDEAVVDRIQLKLRCPDLVASDRKRIFSHFFSAAKADINQEELSKFAEISLNGRQVTTDKTIENVDASRTLDQKRREGCSQYRVKCRGYTLCGHVRLALTANDHIIPTQSNLAFDDGLYDLAE